MFQRLKDWLYELFTSSGILMRLIPVIRPFFLMSLGLSKSNMKLVDEGGETMHLVKFKGSYLPRFGMKTLNSIEKRRIRKDDVMLCGYPKTGCHWVHEILHMLVTGKAEMTKHGKEFAGFIEMLPELFMDSVPSPRVLNTHIRYGELPEQVKVRKTKIILTVRNPKDTVVSYYNHIMILKAFYHYNGSFENFFKLFISGQIVYGCYFDYYLDWEKVMANQTDNQIHVVEFEKLKADPVKLVKEMARFLDIDITDDFAGKIVEVTKFSNMKAKRPGNKMFRKGQVGDWHNWLTEAQSSQIDQVWEDRMSKCFYQPKLN